MATCPECRKSGLKHTLLAEKLPAHGCDECGGVLLSLIAYRSWRESNPPRPDESPATVDQVTVEDTPNAKQCPKCQGIMTKYRIGPDVQNRLDYCARCEEIWLDDGEWDLVQNLAASGLLGRVFTQPWQNRIRVTIADELDSARLGQLVGEDLEFFQVFDAWLATHPEKDTLLAYLQRK